MVFRPARLACVMASCWLALVSISPLLASGSAVTARTRVALIDAAPDAPEVVWALDVSFDSTTPYPTKIITYTVNYTNTDAQFGATHVVITATKSPYVSYLPNGWAEMGGYAYSRFVANVPPNGSGSVDFVVALPDRFTAQMDAFVNTFEIYGERLGEMGADTESRITVLGVPDLVIEDASLSPVTIISGEAFTAAVVIRNAGTGWACNPKAAGCAGFAVDVFVDPSPPPPSYPFDRYGEGFAAIDPLAPGATATVHIPDLHFTLGDRYLLYFKVDNWNCGDGTQPCIPSEADHGLIPESDETDNVFGPFFVFGSAVNAYLPIVLKSYP